MKNKNFTLIIYLISLLVFFSSVNASEEFDFNVTELEILENGNIVKGLKGGKATTDNGYIIIADTFIYDKLTNILKVNGNVKFEDTKSELLIFTDKATYFKNQEMIFTEGNSKAVNLENTITAEKFKFNKLNNILEAENNVEFDDKKRKIFISSEKAIYSKNEDKLFTDGITNAEIEKKYKFNSKNVFYFQQKQTIHSDHKSLVEDGSGNLYELKSFFYEIKKKLLKGKDVNVLSKIDENKKDKYFFSEGFFNFEEKSFISKLTKIKVHKNIFGNKDHDPRLYGSSSQGNQNSTIVNNGIFTSCKFNDSCPPWSIESKKITHDKVKRDMIYENAILKIYDVPVLYFPKFFHPDPTVERRTGFLQPHLNNSKILGSSIFIPYFKTLGPDRDFTFKPTIFEDKFILQNEYRKKTKNSYLVSDFSLTNGYKSSVNNKKKNINHLFLNFKKNLNLPDFIRSDLDLNIQRVNNDTYLKVFQNNLIESPVIPSDKNLMISNINLDMDHEDYNLSTGIKIYENLGVKHSDRYQYVLPSYDFSKNLNVKDLSGSINLYSSGSNTLQNTNNLKTSIINDLQFSSENYYSNLGFVNNYNIYFKNLNSLGKNDPTYKSTPRLEGQSIFQIGSSLPMLKKDSEKEQILTPKISLMVNPGNNMKNYSGTKRSLDANNIFSINRLGFSDSFEAGKSLTLGVDYKLDLIDENHENDKSLEFKLATVIRDTTESEIPTSTTINKKNSNLFGTVRNNLLKDVDLIYNFSVDNNLEKFDYHSLNARFTINNFVTQFDFIEEKGEIGSAHTLSNISSYEIDKNNFISFSTRKNKEINLTEYYDLKYEYKNDCLTAGIKFNKTFYQDNDLKPTENLFFTLTLVPLTTYERSIYDK